MEGYGLGVDLGTTYTAAAIWRAGRAESVPLGVRAHTVPSVLFLREDGVLLVGEAAARRGVTEPERVAREFKRWFGDGIPVFLGDREIPAEDLTGQMLRWVVETVTQREGGPPAHVTLTHPATWGGHRTGLLVTAAEHAGLSDVGLLAEPVAAAAYHASTQRLQPGRVLVVYDLGGGTFDVTVVRKTPGGFAVAGEPCGDDALGGADFDQVVMSHVATTVGPPWQALDLEDEGVLAALARVREDAVAAKEMLSADVDASVPVLLPGVTRDVRITRGEFEAAIRIPLLRTVDLLAQAIEGAGVEAGEVQAVLLVGGSSRIPLVSRLIATELRLPVALDAHPKYAICLGAAIAAGARLAPAAPAPSGWAPPPGGPPGYRSPPPVPWGPAPTGRPAPHPGTRPGMPAAHPGTARPVPGPPPQQPTRRPTPRPLPRPAPGPGGPQRPGTLPPAGPPAGPPGGPPAWPPPAARPGTPPAGPAPRPAACPAPARPSLPAPTVHSAPPRRAPRPAPPVVGAEPPAAVVVDLRGTGISGTVDTAVATTPERPSWAPVLTARDEPVTVTHVADRGRGRRTAVVTVAVALVVVALVTVGALLLPATRQVLTGGAATPQAPDVPALVPAGLATLSDQQVTSAAGDRMSAVTAVGDGAVAVGGSDADDQPRAWRSTGAGAWEPAEVSDRSATLVGGMNGVTRAPGTRGELVAVGWVAPRPAPGAPVPSGPDRQASVWTSPDGRTWSPRTAGDLGSGIPGLGELSDVVTGPGGELVAVGVAWAADPRSGDGVVLRSRDGRTWTAVPATGLDGIGPPAVHRLLADGPGLLGVGARADAGATRPVVWHSPDGIAWSEVAVLPHAGPGSAEATGVVRLPDGTLLLTGSTTALDGTAEPAVWSGPAPGELAPYTVPDTAGSPAGLGVGAGGRVSAVGSRTADGDRAATAWTVQLNR